MSELEMMKKCLEDTGLYDVRNDSVILAELSAYAEGLDICFDALDGIEKEMLVATAEDEGIRVRQQLTGRTAVGTSIEARRSALIKALSICSEDHTLSGMQKVIDSFGLHGELSFDSVNHRTVLNCTDVLTPAKKALLTQRLREYMPCWWDFVLLP